MRERLICLIKNAEKAFPNDKPVLDIEEFVADHLLADGIIVPPCKVGDTVYVVYHEELSEAMVINLDYNYYTNPRLWLTVEVYSKIFGTIELKNRIDLLLGKTVFLTWEEAEAALKEKGE